MSVLYRKSSLFICVPAFLLLLHAPVQGDEGIQDTQDAVATKATPTHTVEHADTLDGEITSARSSVKENASNASAHVQLASLLIKKGALDEAMLSFEEALKLNPHMHEAKTGRGIVLARKGNLQEAEEALKGALLLNPNPVRTHYELGLVYEKLGDLEKAVAEFKEGIKKHEQGR